MAVLSGEQAFFNSSDFEFSRRCDNSGNDGNTVDKPSFYVDYEASG